MSIQDDSQMNNIDLHDNDNTGTRANDFTNSVVHGEPD